MKSAAATQPLFPPALIAALRLGAPAPESGRAPFAPGRHRARTQGESAEFQDFRAYTPGDDLRRIDWNIFRRTRKLLLRRYRHFPQMKHLIRLDNSRSIRCRPCRERTAYRVAALLGGMLLHAGDGVALEISGHAGRYDFAPGNRSHGAYLATLEQAYGAPASPPASFDFRAAGGAKRLWVISDFMDSAGLDHLERALAVAPGFTPIRIFEPEERRPAPDADLRLIDVETGAEAVVSPSAELLRRYAERLARFDALLRIPAARCDSRVCDFDARQPVETLIRQALAFFGTGGKA